MKYIILLLTVTVSLNLYAEVDTTDLALADETLETPSLNIEGQVQQKVAPVEKKIIVQQEVRKPLSPSERLRQRREQLEIRNRIMVEKKMEQIRWQQELALARQLEKSMNQTINAINIK